MPRGPADTPPITAAYWSEMEEDAREAEVSRFLQKPLFPFSLVGCINDCMPLHKNPPSPLPTHDGADGIFAGKNVLLAEDVAINREITIALLEHTGMAIDTAVDGEDAVKKFSAAPKAYDLILMDVHMPNTDGYEATQRIRLSGLPGAASIPIIAMTANVFREDVERCLASGMNVHLGKPIEADEVIANLRRYLTWRGQTWRNTGKARRAAGKKSEKLCAANREKILFAAGYGQKSYQETAPSAFPSDNSRTCGAYSAPASGGCSVP